MSVADYVATILSHEQFTAILCDHRVIQAKEAVFADCVHPWPKPIQDLLNARSLRLFSHQAEAINYIRSGRSVVVSTPTASGKSLIYNLPFRRHQLLRTA